MPVIVTAPVEALTERPVFAVTARLATPPAPVPNGPTVAPLTRAKMPALVIHTSPLIGDVGALPWPIFNPASVVVEAGSEARPK